MMTLNKKKRSVIRFAVCQTINVTCHLDQWVQTVFCAALLRQIIPDKICVFCIEVHFINMSYSPWEPS